MTAELTVGIDIGTTSVKAVAADGDGTVVARARVPHRLLVPAPDQLEHDAVAEMAVALLFAVNRHVVQADADVRGGRVYKGGSIPYQRYRAWQIAGQTVGLVGLGAVGRALAWRLEGLGTKVVSYDPYNPAATHSLDDLLAEADIVSMHAPVTAG